MPADDLVINVYYTANTHTVTFDANQGTFDADQPEGVTVTDGTATKQVAYGSTYGALANVSRDGYTFDGWYDELGDRLSKEPVWSDQYGASRSIVAWFVAK